MFLYTFCVCVRARMCNLYAYDCLLGAYAENKSVRILFIFLFYQMSYTVAVHCSQHAFYYHFLVFGDVRLYFRLFYLKKTRYIFTNCRY